MVILPPQRLLGWRDVVTAVLPARHEGASIWYRLATVVSLEFLRVFAMALPSTGRAPLPANTAKREPRHPARSPSWHRTILPAAL